MVLTPNQWEHDEQRAMEQEIEKLREKNQNLFNALMAATGKNDELHKQLKEQEGYDGIAHDFEKMRTDLENCRLLAARHRNLGMSIEKHSEEFLTALRGGKGDLDAWLECSDEAECRTAILGAIGAEREACANAERESRRMFVARLLNLQDNDKSVITIAQVLSLLDDCDMLAACEADNTLLAPTPNKARP